MALEGTNFFAIISTPNGFLKVFNFMTPTDPRRKNEEKRMIGNCIEDIHTSRFVVFILGKKLRDSVHRTRNKTYKA